MSVDFVCHRKLSTVPTRHPNFKRDKGSCFQLQKCCSLFSNVTTFQFT